jgi:hypothetical protein
MLASDAVYFTFHESSAAYPNVYLSGEEYCWLSRSSSKLSGMIIVSSSSPLGNENKYNDREQRVTGVIASEAAASMAGEQHLKENVDCGESISITNISANSKYKKSQRF